MTERERKAFSLRNTLSHAKSEMRPQTASDERARDIFGHTAAERRCPKVKVPQAHLQRLCLIAKVVILSQGTVCLGGDERARGDLTSKSPLLTFIKRRIYQI